MEYKILEQLNNTENKLIRLVETCGFAGAPWKQEICNIINIIRNAVKTLGPGNEEISFNINDEITSQITFLTNLQIKCKGFLYHKDKNLPTNLGGMVGSYKPLEIKYKDEQKCLDGVFITLYVVYNNDGKILNKYLEGTLSHEINHVYDMFMRIQKNEIIKYNQSVYKYKYFPQDNKFLYNIFYRLFSETEFNALVSSVYSDLKEINSQRENYSIDILNTQAYEVYNEIKNNYNKTVDKLSNKEVQEIKLYLNKYSINIKCDENVSDKTFKRCFKLKIEHLLRKLFKNICRAASYYYDEVEKLQEQKQKQQKLKFVFGKQIPLLEVDKYVIPTGDNIK